VTESHFDPLKIYYCVVLGRDAREWVEFLAMPVGHALFKAFRSIEKKEMRRALIDLVERLGKGH